MRLDTVAVAGARFARALLDGAAAAGCPALLLRSRSRPWVSATFQGSRHRVWLATPDTDAARAWIAALPEAEFHLPRQLVADLAARRDGAELEVEALVLDEA